MHSVQVAYEQLVCVCRLGALVASMFASAAMVDLVGLGPELLLWQDSIICCDLR